jgi:uncharacterized protein (TIGR03085 family)
VPLYSAPMTTVAQQERASLCDLFEEVGPDAPTLCGDWTARDLAAHLVVRERNLVGGAGIVVGALAGFTERGMEREEVRPWHELVERVRSGPMWFSRPIDPLINTFEYFVHHEDVRRGDGTGAPRTGIDDIEDELWKRLRNGASLLVRKIPRGNGLEIARPGGEPVTLRKGDRVARLVGTPGEVTLFLYGRKGVAQVEVEGDEEAVAAVMGADFGV